MYTGNLTSLCNGQRVMACFVHNKWQASGVRGTPPVHHSQVSTVCYRVCYQNVPTPKLEIYRCTYIQWLISERLRNAYTAGEEFNVPAWSIPQTMDCTCDTPCSYTTYITEHMFVPVEEVYGSLNPR